MDPQNESLRTELEQRLVQALRESVTLAEACSKVGVDQEQVEVLLRRSPAFTEAIEGVIAFKQIEIRLQLLETDRIAALALQAPFDLPGGTAGALVSYLRARGLLGEGGGAGSATS